MNENANILLNQAIVEEDPNKVQEAIRRGANVNIPDSEGSTPLHLAVLSCRTPEILEMLLEEGASPNAKDETNNTPLHHAVLLEKMRFALLLMDKGASIDARNSLGQKPLNCARDSVQGLLEPFFENRSHAARIERGRRVSNNGLQPL